ncbi:MAG: hypothetical protein ACLTNW_16775 [Mediterraneibacter gnavus]
MKERNKEKLRKFYESFQVKDEKKEMLKKNPFFVQNDIMELANERE